MPRRAGTFSCDTRWNHLLGARKRLAGRFCSVHDGAPTGSAIQAGALHCAERWAVIHRLFEHHHGRKVANTAERKRKRDTSQAR